MILGGESGFVRRAACDDALWRRGPNSPTALHFISAGQQTRPKSPLDLHSDTDLGQGGQCERSVKGVSMLRESIFWWCDFGRTEKPVALIVQAALTTRPFFIFF